MNEDRKKLRELCDKATQGDWWIDSHGQQLVAHNPFSSIFITHGEAMGPATRHPETGYLSHWPNDWDATYIVSVQPKVVRRLLDEVDAANANHENVVAHMQSVCAERDRLKAENAELRQILSECATACGAGMSPECSLTFMSGLPDEIRLNMPKGK